MKRQTDDGLEEIIEQALEQMEKIGQWQRRFMLTLFKTVLVIQGKINYNSLSRHMFHCGSRHSREPIAAWNESSHS
ncbi:MAG: hypothetical protein AAF708_14930 [Deinococcota bacterium]